METPDYYEREIARIKRARYEYWMKATNYSDPKKSEEFTKLFVAANNELRALRWALDELKGRR